MKLPLIFLIIFSCSPVWSQLSISPAGKSDSYIYIKDRLLYVTKEISLTENRNPETEANIYLRRNAQLLQGEKDINLNKGNGSISIFQNGTSNAYDYNYWCLPVRPSPTKSNLLNDYLYEPLGKTHSRKAKLISSLDGSSSPLLISSRWIYSFSGNNYSNWGYAGNHFDLDPGEGFTMKGVNGKNDLIIEDQPVNSGAAQTYDLRGLPNDGKITIPINRDQTILIGNPYPSAFDLRKFLTENASTTGIAYFWDSKYNGSSHYLSDYEGGYGTYSPGANAYIPPAFKRYSDGNLTGNTGVQKDRKVLPVAQGFMVKGKSSGEIVFKNSHRLYLKQFTSQSDFKNSENQISSLQLFVQLDSLVVKELLLAFREDSSIDEDHAMDALEMNQNPSSVNWNINDKNYVINVRPKIDEELIPLNLHLHKITSLKFYAGEMRNFNPDRLFVYDSKDDLYFPITSGFIKLQLPEGEYKNRFYISFIERLPQVAIEVAETSEAISPKNTNVLLNTIDIFQNNRDERLEVKMLYEAGIKEISLFNMNGKLISHKSFKSFEKEYYLPTGKFSTAVYIVKLNTSDNKEITKKLEIRN